MQVRAAAKAPTHFMVMPHGYSSFSATRRFGLYFYQLRVLIMTCRLQNASSDWVASIARASAGMAMMAPLPTLLFMFAAFLVPVVAHGQPVAKQNDADATFSAVKELNQDASAPRLGNGEPADPLQWQASFYSWSENFECSSTLIGPRVL